MTSKVSNIEIAFLEYSSSKKALLRPDIVEYNPGSDKPMYDLIIGKETMHDLGIVLDFNRLTAIGFRRCHIGHGILAGSSLANCRGSLN